MTEALAGTDPAALVFDGEFLRKLEKLEWVARKALRGLPRGERSTARRGRGLEFDDFRRYQPGDDFRYIDWNIFSRLDRLVVKLYTSEEDLTLHLALDCSASMGFGEPTKFDYARRLAAALGFIGLHHLDRVALTTFGNAHAAGPPPFVSRSRLSALLDYLSGLRPSGSTRYETSFRELAASTRGARLMVVISDFMGEGALPPALDALRHRGHDVVAMQVLSEEEIAPPLDGALALVDSESGEALRATVDERLRALYRERLDARLRGLEGYCRRSGVEYLRTSTAIDFEALVLRYLRQGTHLR